MNTPSLPMHSNSNRRNFLRLLALAGGAATFPSIISACAKSSMPKDLNFWGTGTLDIGTQWGVLEKDRNLRVQFEDNNNDPGPVITKLTLGGEAKTRHISGLQGGAERELANQGAIIPWNTDLIPSYGSLWPWAAEIKYTKVENQVYGIPTVINADSIIYLPERTGPIDSYSAVFDPRFRGRASMEDAWINSVIFTAIYLKENELLSIQDPGNLTEGELSGVMKFLEEKARDGQFRKLWSGWEDGLSLIVNEEVWAMTGWEPIVYAARRQGKNVEYAVPREGYEGWSNDVVLHPGVKAAKVYEEAHQLIDWELSGFYGCVLASQRGYVVPTDNALRYSELHPQDFKPGDIRGVVENVKRKFFAMKGQVYWQNVRPDNFQLYGEKWDHFRTLVS